MMQRFEVELDLQISIEAMGMEGKHFYQDDKHVVYTQSRDVDVSNDSNDIYSCS